MYAVSDGIYLVVFRAATAKRRLTFINKTQPADVLGSGKPVRGLSIVLIAGVRGATLRVARHERANA
jgi:hypothetical protein